MDTIETLMKKLHITEEEAREVIEYDIGIDKGAPSPYDLDEEHQKVAKEMSNMETHKKKDKTVFCEDITKTSEKAKILLELSTFLANSDEICANSIEFLNVERQLSFCVGDNLYELTLIQKRK